MATIGYGPHTGHANSLPEAKALVEFWEQHDRRVRENELLRSVKYGHNFDNRYSRCDCGKSRIDYELEVDHEICPVAIARLCKRK